MEKRNAANCGSIMKYLGLDLGKGPIHIQNTCPVAVLSGSWFEMGYQYAVQAHRPIRYNIGAQLGLFLKTWGSYEAMYQELPVYEGWLLDFFPDYIDFIKGMRDGLASVGYDLAYEDVLLGYVTLGRPEQQACAAVSAWGGATGTGEVYAGIHSDSPHVANYTHPAILAYPNNANAFLSFTGFTNGYMNDKGLVCMGTAGPAGRPEDIANGNPICIGLLYNAAYSSNAQEAVDAHIKVGRVGSGEICHYVDAGGNGFILETTAGHYAVRRSGDFGEKDFLVQTNCFLTEEMKLSGGNLPTNLRRYDSIFQYITTHAGALTIDELREAMANTAYYLKERGEWVYEWKEETGTWSPERRDPVKGPAMRRMFNLSKGIAYILCGAEDPLVSKVPHALGAYAAMKLGPNPTASAAFGLEEARLQLWMAARDLDGLRCQNTTCCSGAFSYQERRNYFDEAKEAVYLCLNCINLAAAAVNPEEKMSLLGKSLTASNRAQCYAKAAQSGDPARLERK